MRFLSNSSDKLLQHLRFTFLPKNLLRINVSMSDRRSIVAYCYRLAMRTCVLGENTWHHSERSYAERCIREKYYSRRVPLRRGIFYHRVRRCKNTLVARVCWISIPLSETSLATGTSPDRRCTLFWCKMSACNTLTCFTRVAPELRKYHTDIFHFLIFSERKEKRERTWTKLLTLPAWSKRSIL